MKFFKRVVLINILALSALFTYVVGANTISYIPLISDDSIIFIPKSIPQIPSYIPPANSIGHTTIVTTTGKKIRVDSTPNGFVFEGYVGKIVLLEVYGDTCPHCIAAIPSYNALQKKYLKDVVIIALESYGTLGNASQQQYITIPKVDTGTMFSSIQSLTGYNRQAVPYLMILDRKGDYVYEKVLADFPEATIDGIIQGLL